MKKSIYLAAIAAIALSACSNDNDSVFDQSAADRLEQYKKDYAEVLTADGGLWSMEYFSNEDEPGYVFVMKFDKNGSVEISGNHKWIGGTYKKETSLWKMIADNGPVLSFNSYNPVFHIFADPANIEGPDAPKGELGEDINETGYGHAGDYEFQFMEVSDDGQTVRLLGKKRLYDIYLHRLDSATDAQDYLDRNAKVANMVSPHFGYVNMIAPDGEMFIINNLETGVVSAYPQQGDPITQTRKSNGIFTLEGFRFMFPFEIPRATGNDYLIVESFTFQQDGSLLSPEGISIVGPDPYDVFLEETVDYSWFVEIENSAGVFATDIATLSDGIKEAYPTRSLESVYFGHEVFNGAVTPSINVKLSGTKAATYYIEYTSASKDGIGFKIVDSNSQANTFDKKTQALRNFAENIAKHTFTISSEDIMAPEILELVDVQNSADKIVVKVN